MLFDFKFETQRAKTSIKHIAPPNIALQLSLVVRRQVSIRVAERA
jgi:hypothetical protein